MRTRPNLPEVEYQTRPGNDLGVECFSLASLYERAPTLAIDPSRPHRLKFNNLILITGGTGTHFVDFHQYPVRAGDLIYVRRDQIHAFDLRSKPQGKVLLFTPGFIDHLRAEIRFPFFTPYQVDASSAPVFKARAGVARSCEVLMNEIMLAADSSRPALVIRLLVAALILTAFAERPDDPSRLIEEHRQNKFRAFIKQVEANFTQTREAAAYAGMIHVTYKTLNDICKQCCSQTAKQVIDAHTVLEAKRRLAIEQVRVEQLADDLGFDEATNFVKYFKKHTALTPARFKQQFTG